MSPEPSFYGWRVVAAAFVVAIFGWGIGFYGPPVYLEAVRDARGWSIALVSGAVTLHFLSGVGIAANLSRLHGRFGLPAVTVAGAVALAFGVLGWAIAQAPWQLYAAALLSGAGWPALGAAAVNAIVAPWFVAKRPAALSMAFNGASIGGVIFSPLWVVLIGEVGFPAAALMVGAAMIGIVGTLAFIVLGRTPESMGQTADGREQASAEAGVKKPATLPVRHLGRDRAFVTLSLGMMLALFAQIGLIAQLVSVLAPALGTRGAGVAAGLSTASAILGRVLVGWCMPPGADRRHVAAINLAVQALGCGAFMLSGGTNVGGLLLGIILFGLGIGNATSLPPLIAQVEFTRAEASKVVALIVALAQGAYAFAPATFGLMRELGSDQAIFVAAAGIQIAAAAVYLIGCSAYSLREQEAGP